MGIKKSIFILKMVPVFFRSHFIIKKLFKQKIKKSTSRYVDIEENIYYNKNTYPGYMG